MKARVFFDLDTQGAPTNIRVETSVGPSADDEVIALIREWRFQAALDHGVAVEAKGFVDLTRGLEPEQPPRPVQVPIQPPMKKQ